MLRPRRTTSQKSDKQEEEEEEASNDELDLSEVSSDGDFSSASSDEWRPKIANGGNEETIEESDHTASDDSEGEDEDEESAVESPVKSTNR